MTFATFSQPDNRPYRKSIPPSTKTRKSLLTGGAKLRFGRLHPRTSAFAPYLAYIWQIRQSDRRHFLTKSATCSTLFPNRHLPNPVARLRRIHHDAPSQTFPSDALTGLGRGSGLRWRLWRAPTRHGWQHTKRWSLANRLRNRCAQASIRVRYAAY